MAAAIAADKALHWPPDSVDLEVDLAPELEDAFRPPFARRCQIVPARQLAQRHVVERRVRAEVINEGVGAQEEVRLLLAGRLGLPVGQGLHVEGAGVARLLLAVTLLSTSSRTVPLLVEPLPSSTNETDWQRDPGQWRGSNTRRNCMSAESQSKCAS